MLISVCDAYIKAYTFTSRLILVVAALSCVQTLAETRASKTVSHIFLFGCCRISCLHLILMWLSLWVFGNCNYKI